jgi:hypothetical protein
VGTAHIQGTWAQRLKSTMRKMRAVGSIAAGTVVTLYSGAYLFLWATQTEKVLLPMRELQTTPARVGLAAEGVRIQVGSGAAEGELLPCRGGYWRNLERAAESMDLVARIPHLRCRFERTAKLGNSMEGA